MLIASVSYYGVESFLASVEAETARITTKTAEIDANIERMQPDLQKFDQLSKQIDLLKNKLLSLESITVSRVSRYLSVILLEHLQNLKPEGVWFSSLSIDSKRKEISIAGGSFDNLLVAEFINQLEETEKRKVEVKDLSSFVYFDKVKLEKVSNTKSSNEGEEAPQTLSEGQKALKKVGEGGNAKDGLAKAGTTSASDVSRKKVSVENTLFPELNSFPAFTLVIKYAERNFDQPRKSRVADGSKL